MILTATTEEEVERISEPAAKKTGMRGLASQPIIVLM